MVPAEVVLAEASWSRVVVVVVLVVVVVSTKSQVKASA